MSKQNIIIYNAPDGKTSVALYAKDGDVWMNQNQLSKLFDTSIPNVSMHISNILKEGELKEDSVVKDYLTTATDGKDYNVTFYSLDMILAIGFRVRSKRGTQFRIWANQNLKSYLVKGFLMDDERLKNPDGRPDYFDEILERIREIRANALESEGVEEIIKIEGGDNEEDLFSDEYLRLLDNIKMPNTKIQMLQMLLKKAIGALSKVNKMQGVDFSKKMQALVESYNEREGNTYTGEEFAEIAEAMTNLIYEIKKEFSAGDDLGIDFEEKAFYDILKALAAKYDFDYPEDKTLLLAKEIKKIVDDKASYTDWSKRDDIKAELKVDLIILLGDNGYPPVDRDEVYKEVFEQAENFKKNR